VHAQECLVLNGLKIDEFPLTVLISDPAVKAKRTDADESVNRTLFIGGLTPNTTEQDVEAILRDHGKILHVKLGWDPLKRICKGFAFVEMATEVSLAVRWSVFLQ
jgi:RNA recognition motif-containing protein